MPITPLGDRLPDLPPDPPEASHECNICGALFDLGNWDEWACPDCDSRDVHRG